MQGEPFGKRSNAAGAVEADETATAFNVVCAGHGAPEATGSVYAVSATAQFAGGAGVARVAATVSLWAQHLTRRTLTLAARGVQDLACGTAVGDTASVTQHLPRR